MIARMTEDKHDPPTRVRLGNRALVLVEDLVYVSIAVLLAAGAPGKRSALPNSRILIHQPHGGVQGQTVDMELAVKEMVEMRERMIDILVRATNQLRARIALDIDRDYTVRGSEAVAYGLVDTVIERRHLALPTAAMAPAVVAA